MTILFAIIALVLLLAMACGQLRVAYRAINHEKVGYGRFTYKRSEAPLGFWIMAAAEWLGYYLMFALLFAVLTAVLLS